MITMEQALRVREELLSILDEDAHNREKILQKFEKIKNEKGVSPYSALFLILTHLPFEENEAKRHWEAVLQHRRAMIEGIGRDVGFRVALFDYFINLNKKIVDPKIIELSLFERVDRTSSTDMLTGLPNHRSFMNALSIELRRCKRYGLKCSVLMLDLDDFKKVNDEYGDLVGDIILREASMIIRNCIRDIDTAYRYGGEEFVIIFPETQRLGAYIVSERIREAVERHFMKREVNNLPLNLTVSGGIALFPDDAMTLEDFIKKALEALYQAKARGKNAVNSYFHEKRNFLRFDLLGDDVKIEMTDDAEEMKKDRWVPETKNLSKSGMLITSDRLFSIGQILEICLYENDNNEVLSLSGRVVRVEEMEEEGDCKYEIGVAFIVERENQEQKLLELIDKFRKSSRR